MTDQPPASGVMPQGPAAPGRAGWWRSRTRGLILGRLASAVPLVLAVTFVSFGLLRLAPGGPFDRERAPASPETEQALRARYHLDASLPEQYLRYLGVWWEPDALGGWRRAPGGLLAGDLGPSLKYRSHGVNDIVWQALPVSAGLGALAFLTALAIGLPLGMLSAVHRHRATGRTANGLALLVICLPAFVVGPLLVMLFSLTLSWLPAALWESPAHWMLPALTLGLFFAGRIARLLREGLLETLPAPFITAGRARGLSERRLLWRHAFPIAVLPVLSYSGPLLADLLTGSFVVETIFQVPGVGVFLVNGVLNRDYTLVVGLVVVYALLLVALNLAVDLVSAWLDPRIGKGRA